MTPRNLIEELGRRLNTTLALDGAGLARIVVDDSLPVDFELDEANERLLVYSVIGILPEGKAREQFFEELLAANLSVRKRVIVHRHSTVSATKCCSGSRSVRTRISTARPQRSRTWSNRPCSGGIASATPTQARRRPA